MRLPWIVVLALVAAGCGSKPARSGAPAQPGQPGQPPAFGGLPSGPIGTAGAERLLMQGTFGATLDGIKATAGQTYAQWFAAQTAAPVSLLSPQATQANSDFYTPWWTVAVDGQDQLRQRVAFALSQILVVSNGSSAENGQSISLYADVLSQGALGNFRDLLENVTLSPAMGQYLTYFRNDKPNPATGAHADENYAREVMQLFTVGLVMLNPDGSVVTDSSGNPVPTYGLPEITNLARVFTGWASNPLPGHGVSDDSGWLNDVDNLHPMVCYPQHHDTGAKTIIGGVQIPAGGTCKSDTDAALDALFHHPNVGPFIGKQLIQRLVTSNPSPAYVSRVAGAFANNGSGVRGDLLATVEAVLTDPEAINPGTASRLREPVLRFTELYRAFAAADLANDGKIPEYQVVSYQGFLNFAQNVYSSPTVFNFYRPDYQRPGPLLSAGLVAPEFQITNEYSSVVLTNQLENSAYQYVDSSGAQFSAPADYTMPTDGTSVMLHTAQWEPLAADASTLVDNLNAVFMAGQMPAAMRSVIVDYVNGLGSSAPAAQRAAEAAFLVVGSPQFAVQR